MTPKLRASYSILASWEKGRFEEATLFYFRLKSFTSPQMADGTDYHKKWEEHVRLTHTLPREFGGTPLKNPEVELKLQVSLGDWIDLVAKIDCISDGTIYDWKTGRKNSSEYIESMQLPIYGLAAKLSDRNVRSGKIMHFDQYSGAKDQSLIWLTKKSSKDALEWIKKYGSQMHEYFLKEGLYEKFGNREPIVEEVNK